MQQMAAGQRACRVHVLATHRAHVVVLGNGGSTGGGTELVQALGQTECVNTAGTRNGKPVSGDWRGRQTDGQKQRHSGAQLTL